MGDNSAIKRFFKVFEVIASLMVINIVFILGSVASLLILTPSLIFAMFHLSDKMYRLHFDDIVFDFFKDIKTSFIKTTKTGFLSILFIAILSFVFIEINPLIFETISVPLYGSIIGSQLLLLYILVSYVMMSEMIMVKQDFNVRMMDAFLLIFAYPIRTIIAFVSMFIIPGFLISISVYFVFIIIPISLIGYYIILKNVQIK